MTTISILGAIAYCAAGVGVARMTWRLWHDESLSVLTFFFWPLVLLLFWIMALVKLKND